MLTLKNQNLRLPTKQIKFTHVLGAQLLADKLYAFMKENNGLGLAANQVGLRDSVFVMEVDGVRYDVFNPEFLLHDLHPILVNGSEGCLSYPGEAVDVVRYDSIHVRYYNADGNVINNDLHGLTARVYQHELDHLHGITMHDRKKMQEAKARRDIKDAENAAIKANNSVTVEMGVKDD